MSFDKMFSKELAGDLRSDTAKKLNEARQKPEDFKSLKKITEETGLADEYTEWSDIALGFESLKKNLIGRILRTEKYREAESSLSETLKIKKEADIEKIQIEYRNKFDEILRNCPLSKEERDRYLSSESLEQMNLEDYLTLLKRLSGEAFYHVTRYGVRENVFTSTGGGHSAGEGIFVNSFTSLLKDGKINTFLSTVSADESKIDYILDNKFIEESKKKGMPVDQITNELIKAYYSTDYPLDRESAHFSYGKDLHGRYGGENDYKFYFYFPAEYILNNDYFYASREGSINIGKGYNHNRSGIEQQYNDFEIFNFGKGVPVNAGILCIDGGVEVDPVTGSQYLLKDGKPMKEENGKYSKPENTISSKEYWETYFKKYPELKPNKIIYERFSTGAYTESKDLIESAKDKLIYNQSDEKKEEFTNYRKEMRIVLEKIVKKAVQEKE